MWRGQKKPFRNNAVYNVLGRSGSAYGNMHAIPTVKLGGGSFMVYGSVFLLTVLADCKLLKGRLMSYVPGNS